MPIGPPSHVPEPKSAWTCLPVPMPATIAEEFAATGSWSTRARQMSSAGATAQPPSPASAPAARAGVVGDGEAFDRDGVAEADAAVPPDTDGVAEAAPPDGEPAAD